MQTAKYVVQECHCFAVHTIQATVGKLCAHVECRSKAKIVKRAGLMNEEDGYEDVSVWHKALDVTSWIAQACRQLWKDPKAHNHSVKVSF
jgi:hypothetical protein